MSLDTLYSPGTAAAFAECVDLTAIFPGSEATILESDCEDGSVAVETTWAEGKTPIGIYRLIYFPTTVHCSWLQVESGYRSKGLNLLLMKRLSVWWPTLGLLTHTMGHNGGLAEKVLLSCGYHELPSGDFGTPLDGTGRGFEFLRWIAAGAKAANEPAWRKALGPIPPVF